MRRFLAAFVLLALGGPAVSASVSTHAEDAVLAAFLIGGRRHADSLTQVAAFLEPGAFRSTGDRALYEAETRLHRTGQTVDYVTLEAELQRTGKLEDVGGIERLAELIELIPTADNVEDHARLVLEDARRRRWHALLSSSLEELTEADAPSLDELMASHADHVARLQAATGGTTRTILLADVLASPEMLEPPPALIPRIAWRGRTTLLAAREKLGKSTLCAAAAAARSSGHRFLGNDLEAGTVLWVGLEEHVGDAARRFREFGAEGARVHLLERVVSPLADLEQAVRETGPDVVFVDTLAAFTEAMQLDPGSSTAWTPVMSRLARIARDHQVALVIIHHGRKSDDKYRDSSAIGAGVDMILEMSEGQIEGVRKIAARGRWSLEGYSVRMVGATDQSPAFFEIASGDVGIDAQVVAHVSRNQGCSSRDITSAVRGRTQDVMASIHRLAGRQIEDRGTARRSSWHLKASESPETLRETPRKHSGNGSGNDGAPVFPTRGTPPEGGCPRETHPETPAGER